VFIAGVNNTGDKLSPVLLRVTSAHDVAGIYAVAGVSAVVGPTVASSLSS
jgi:hypothetical protein